MHTFDHGRNIDSNSAPSMPDKVVVGVNTTMIVPANPDRRVLRISFRKKNGYVKLQAASVDNDERGEWQKKDTTWKMNEGAIYPGEVSVHGNGAECTATEY